MIGGLMLLCAVGAMVLIAWWSLPRDDMEQAEAATGLLALREWPERTIERRFGTGSAARRGGQRSRSTAPQGRVPAKQQSRKRRR